MNLLQVLLRRDGRAYWYHSRWGGGEAVFDTAACGAESFHAAAAVDGSGDAIGLDGPADHAQDMDFAEGCIVADFDAQQLVLAGTVFSAPTDGGVPGPGAGSAFYDLVERPAPDPVLTRCEDLFTPDWELLEGGADEDALVAARVARRWAVDWLRTSWPGFDVVVTCSIDDPEALRESIAAGELPTDVRTLRLASDAELAEDPIPPADAFERLTEAFQPYDLDEPEDGTGRMGTAEAPPEPAPRRRRFWPFG